MKTDWQKTPAYQGRGWKARRLSAREERGQLWSPFAVNSEWAKLEAVALYRPSSELRAIRNPRAVQHLNPVALPRLRREYTNLIQTFRRLRIRVIEVDPALLPAAIRRPTPNLMFVRDLFFNTPEGAVIARMASRVRAGEEKFAAATLATHAVPLLATMSGRVLFEGADALWLNPRTILCGVGNRTNAAAFTRLRDILSNQGVRTHAIKMPKGVQHLLGLLQITGPHTAAVRTELAPKELLRHLRGFDLIEVPESGEVTLQQAMNFVTIAENKVVMASGCPNTRSLLEKSGLRVAAEVKISQLCNAAGGLACATGIVGRRLV